MELVLPPLVLYAQGWLLPLFTSIACNNSLKSTNSPAAAAVINLAGVEGMVPLNGAK